MGLCYFWGLFDFCRLQRLPTSLGSPPPVTPVPARPASVPRTLPCLPSSFSCRGSYGCIRPTGISPGDSQSRDPCLSHSGRVPSPQKVMGAVCGARTGTGHGRGTILPTAALTRPITKSFRCWDFGRLGLECAGQPPAPLLGGSGSRVRARRNLASPSLSTPPGELRQGLFHGHVAGAGAPSLAPSPVPCVR